MKKDSKGAGSVKAKQKGKSRKSERITIGLDLGDKTSHYCALAEDGEKLYEGKVATSKQAMRERFGALARCRIALEVGTFGGAFTARLTLSAILAPRAATPAGSSCGTVPIHGRS